MRLDTTDRAAREQQRSDQGPPRIACAPGLRSGLPAELAVAKAARPSLPILPREGGESQDHAITVLNATGATLRPSQPREVIAVAPPDPLTVSFLSALLLAFARKWSEAGLGASRR
jgi:hypothetical protein